MGGCGYTAGNDQDSGFRELRKKGRTHVKAKMKETRKAAAEIMHISDLHAGRN